MNKILADKLKDVDIDFANYGAFPSRDDIFLIVPQKEEDKKDRSIVKQWEKLLYVRSNLKNLDNYIKSCSEAPLSDWLKNKNVGMSNVVLQKVGSHNNTTGGISAYFFNLQKFYDDEEAKYDAMESLAIPTPDIKASVEGMRNTRGNKRKFRSTSRKLFMRDMKADGKGYLAIEEEMPIHNADGSLAEGEVKTEPKKELPAGKEDPPKVVQDVKKNGKRIGVAIAGTVIFIAVAFAIAGSINNNK